MTRYLFRKETTGPVDFPVRSEEHSDHSKTPLRRKDPGSLQQVQCLCRLFCLKHQVQQDLPLRCTELFAYVRERTSWQEKTNPLRTRLPVVVQQWSTANAKHTMIQLSLPKTIGLLKTTTRSKSSESTDPKTTSLTGRSVHAHDTLEDADHRHTPRVGDLAPEKHSGEITVKTQRRPGVIQPARTALVSVVS